MVNRRYIKIIIFSMLMYTTFNFVHPVTPEIVADKFGESQWIFGAMFAAMSLGSLLMAPFWGSIADKYGRKWLILGVGLLGYAAAQSGLALAETYTQILMVRFFAGVLATSVCYPLIATYLSDITPTNRKTRVQIINVALIGLMSPIGYKVGAYIGENYGIYSTIWAQVAGMGILFILGIFLLEQTDFETSNTRKSNNVFKSLKHSLKMNKGTGLIPLLAMFIPFYIVRVTNGKFLDVMQSNNGYSPTQIANTAFKIGIITTGFMLLVAPILAKKFKDMSLMRISAFVVSIPIFIGALSQSIEVLIIMMIIYNMARNMLFSLHIGYITKTYTKDQATIIGLQRSFTDFGSVIGPLFIGFIFTYNNWLAFLILAFCGLGTAIMLLFKKDKKVEISEAAYTK